jgi:predicted CoA-binding protein
VASKAAVNKFLSQRKLAVIGVSRNKKKFGSLVYRELKARGYRVFAVNPNAESVEGDRCYAGIRELPEPVDGLVAVVPPAAAEEIVREAYAAGIKNVWLQQGAESERTVRFCREKGINCVYGQCILMFLEPVRFPHSLHRWVWKRVGRFPR